jgi:energy-converting hydrogenase Eha subunit H
MSYDSRTGNEVRAVVSSSVLPSGASTQTTLAALLAKIPVDGSGNLLLSDTVTLAVVDTEARTKLGNIQSILEDVLVALEAIQANAANIKPNSGATGLIATLT